MVDDGRGDMKGDGTCGVAREQGVSLLHLVGFVFLCNIITMDCIL